MGRFKVEMIHFGGLKGDFKLVKSETIIHESSQLNSVLFLTG